MVWGSLSRKNAGKGGFDAIAVGLRSLVLGMGKAHVSEAQLPLSWLQWLFLPPE